MVFHQFTFPDLTVASKWVVWQARTRDMNKLILMVHGGWMYFVRPQIEPAY
jgi:hypothetical protein